MKKNIFAIIISLLFVISCKDKPKNDFTKLAALDIKLETPKDGEWLAEHHEDGQTFEQYKKIKPVSVSKSVNCIYIQPIGTFTEQENKVVEYTVEYVSLFFGLKTILLKPITEESIPKENKRILEGNEQLDASFINNNLLPKYKPKDGIVIMALTAKDLYPQPSWNYVFGLANYKNRTGVSSIFRFSDETLSESNYSMCLRRIIKTSTHEIGHMFSLKHCINASCLMNGVNNLSEDDIKPTTLCSECLEKLSWNLKFDNKSRFTNLINFLKLHHLEIDASVTQKQFNAINNN